jgi:low temperature requirement protein LtrA
VLAAADAYSYIHLLIVAGIIIFAVGVKLLVLRHDVASHLRDPARLALCGGVALYLLGNVAFRLRMVGVVGYEKLLAAAALLVLYLVGGRLPAWSVAATITALMAVLCLIETLADRVGVSPQPAREREHEGAAPA